MCIADSKVMGSRHCGQGFEAVDTSGGGVSSGIYKIFF
jgi:hypothetical protein